MDSYGVDLLRVGVHMLIGCGIILTAFTPKELLPFFFHIPFLVVLSWLVYDGCVLDLKHKDGISHPTDLHYVLTTLTNRMGVEAISEQTTMRVVHTIVVLLPTIMVARLLNIFTF